MGSLITFFGVAVVALIFFGYAGIAGLLFVGAVVLGVLYAFLKFGVRLVQMTWNAVRGPIFDALPSQLTPRKEPQRDPAEVF